jgi:hypothetical protein
MEKEQVILGHNVVQTMIAQQHALLLKVFI